MKKKPIATLALLAGMALPVMAKDGLDLTGTSKYYKIHPQFHPFPDEGKPLQSIDRFGPVGIGIFLTQPAFKMQVKNVEPGSPAEATGKLKKDQIIDSINGQVMKDRDPREILGDIIAKAEATDGVVKLVVRDNATAQPVEVIVKIPVLGAYGKTWPLNDAKSDKVVRGLAGFVSRTGSNGMGLGALFLLSTGEEKDLEVVRGWMQKVAAENKDKKELDPEEGKFRWDGTFAPNEKVAGTWTQVGEVATVEAFVPSAKLRTNPLLPAKLTFAANGRTDDPLIYYTGGLLMHLNTNQALKMSIKAIDGVDYLFIESGGFAAKNGPTWKSGFIVLKRG